MSKEYPCVHWSEGRCKKFSDDKVTSWCVESPCEYQRPSNANRIRAMSDEELLQVLCMFLNGNLFDLICDNPKRTVDCDSKCVKCISEWLKQPAEEG